MVSEWGRMIDCLMKLLPTLIGISVLFVSSAFASEKSEGEVAVVKRAPWERHAVDVETGLIWNVGNNTQINYRIVPMQLSWRSPWVWKKEFTGGAKLVLRNQLSLIADWIEKGPEDYYLGISGAPALEWWSADDRWSVYAAVGGGFGLTNSQGVVGGQGQDFTYNWFAKGGVRYQVDEGFGVFGGVFFKHLSNRGATDPNPGIDALGFTMGVSFSF